MTTKNVVINLHVVLGAGIRLNSSLAAIVLSIKAIRLSRGRAVITQNVPAAIRVRDTYISRRDYERHRTSAKLFKEIEQYTAVVRVI